jgi:hypothetical protein
MIVSLFWWAFKHNLQYYCRKACLEFLVTFLFTNLCKKDATDLFVSFEKIKIYSLDECHYFNIVFESGLKNMNQNYFYYILQVMLLHVICNNILHVDYLPCVIQISSIYP